MTTFSQTRANHSLALAGAITLALFTASATLAATPIERLQEDAPKSWGQWGENDEVGALNYLGAEQVKSAAGVISSGKVFSLQIPMSHNFGPVFPGRIPMMHYMAQDESSFAAGKKDVLPGGVKFSDDIAFMYLQGTTHVDALGHAWYGNQIYGGVAADTTVDGHSHADVAAIGKRGITGHAVLLDVGRFKGGNDGRLDPNECISLDDLQATAEAQGTSVDKRDIIILRTGSMERYFDQDTNSEWDAMTEPGLCYSPELVSWFADMETPMLAADNLGVEKVPQEIDGETILIPLHGALIRDLGIVLSEIYWLRDLAADSAEDGQYEFMFVAAPLQVEGGTGAPVNPIAIK